MSATGVHVLSYCRLQLTHILRDSRAFDSTATDALVISYCSLQLTHVIRENQSSKKLAKRAPLLSYIPAVAIDAYYTRQLGL